MDPPAPGHPPDPLDLAGFQTPLPRPDGDGPMVLVDATATHLALTVQPDRR